MAVVWMLLAVLVVLVAVFAALCFLGTTRRDPEDVSVKRSLCGLLANLVLLAQGTLPSGWGVANKEGKVTIPDKFRQSLSAIQQNWKVDKENFTMYCQLCDFVDHLEADKLREPHCYVESTFFGLFLKIISSPDFPISPLGLIHLRQTMNIHSPLVLCDLPKFSLEAHVSEVRVVEKGIEIDVSASAYAMPERKLVWEGVTTVLSRNKATQSRTRQGTKQAHPPPSKDESMYTGKASFEVPADIGWKFAGVCGDYSPHHLTPYTARMIGYRRHMAHGMWTLSRTLSTLLNYEDCQFSTSYPLQIAVHFKRPLFLPASAQVRYYVTEENGSKVIKLKVTTQNDESLNLEASVRCNSTS